ncbi:MAG: hypothetical protein ABI878_09180, partial [Acidobacteriota bacterium]
IIKVTDVNGDGISEILSIGGYAGMGVDTEGVGIGQISGNKYQDIKGFNTSYSNCADEAAERRNSVASIISYVPTTGSKMPLFSEEYFQAGCEDNPSWKNITKKQFDGYFDDKN